MTEGAIALSLERAALEAAWRHRRLWLLHAVANAVLFGAGYAALRVPDEKLWQVALFFLLAVILVAAALLLHGGTFLFFRRIQAGETSNLLGALGGARRRLAPLALWAVLLGGVLWLAGLVDDRIEGAAAWLGSYLTLHWHTPVKPARVETALEWLLWLVEWFVVPMILLPLAAEVADSGFAGFLGRGWRGVWRVVRRGRCWIGYAMFFALGILLPSRLLHWVPKLNGVWLELLSLLVRLGIAYAMFIAIWLVLASWLGRATLADPGPESKA